MEVLFVRLRWCWILFMAISLAFSMSCSILGGNDDDSEYESSADDDDEGEGEASSGDECMINSHRCVAEKAQFCDAGKWVTLATCSSSATCREGVCIDQCNPQCANRKCGADGCGGVCGNCDSGEYCNESGSCFPKPASCGNNTCDASETCLSCPEECGECCGNGSCEAGYNENCLTCVADCACGEGTTCMGNSCVTDCTPSCAGKECGDDGCGGNCGLCDDGEACENGLCKATECTPNCAGKECGNNGCDGSCGTCPTGEQCDTTGNCVSEADCPDSCGNLWYTECTSDNYGYKTCGIDESNPQCTKESTRIACGEGRDCYLGVCSGACLIPEIIFLVDRSSSMTTERWELMTTGLMEFVEKYQGRAEMGLRMFPGGDGCYGSNVVSIQRNNAYNIENGLTPPSSAASTPITAALEDLKPYFGDPNEGQYVILLTDGGESCEDESAPVEAVKLLRSQGIVTYTVGISTQANVELLTEMAEAAGTALGGTNKVFLIQTKAELVSALEDIFKRFDACLCYPSEKTCTTDNNYKECSADGKNWAKSEKCPYFCDEDSGGCSGNCNNNDYKCIGNTSYDCQNYTWYQYQSCGESLGCNPSTGECYPSCKPDTAYCNYEGSSVYKEYRCNSDGTDFEVYQECTNGCDADSIHCKGTTQICTPGDYKCIYESSYYEYYEYVCNSTGSIWDYSQTCSNGCDTYGERCKAGSVCTPGAYKCAYDNYYYEYYEYKCNSAGDEWSYYKSCASECDSYGEHCSS